MIRPSLFRNYILLSIFTTVGVILIGFASSSYLTHLQRERERLQQPPSSLLVFIGRSLGRLDPGHPERAFDLLRESSRGAEFVNFWLVDGEGKVIQATTDKAWRFEWADLKLPDEVNKVVPVDLAAVKKKHPHSLWRLFWPPPPGPFPHADIIRLTSQPATYLVSEFRPRPGKEMESELLIFRSALLISVILASLITFGLISWHVRRKALMAEEVMSRMQKGDLKARFPVQRHDEIGRIMLLFNRMGDEIERLVEKVRRTERARLFITQELAHDLRTPIASLKSMLETLLENDAGLSEKLRAELMQMSLEEVNYFARLVEDLLLLAQVLEPQYQAPFEKINAAEILRDEIERMNIQQQALPSPKRLKLQIDPALKEPTITGDEGLLRRVFRNTLQNALVHARREVQVRLRQEGAELAMSFQDDGPGFAPEVLENFGERRVSRYINSQEGASHLSVGLGSVIIKKVVEAHRGRVSIRNGNDLQGVAGAEVLIHLPLPAEESVPT